MGSLTGAVDRVEVRVKRSGFLNTRKMVNQMPTSIVFNISKIYTL